MNPEEDDCDWSTCAKCHLNVAGGLYDTWDGQLCRQCFNQEADHLAKAIKAKEQRESHAKGE